MNVSSIKHKGKINFQSLSGSCTYNEQGEKTSVDLQNFCPHDVMTKEAIWI